MVFRKDSKIDAFQRQISALRQQLGPNPDDPEGDPLDDEAYDAEPVEMTDVDQGVSRNAYAPAVAESAGTSYQSDEADSPYATAAPAQRRGDLMSTSAPSIAVPIADDQTSVVAHDMTLKGDLQSEGTIHVHGRVEGTIKAKRDVFVAEEADIDATITATNVVIAGYVKGGIRCGNRFEVLPQGRVDGEIQAPTLVIHDGATIVGQFRMGAGEGTETRPASVPHRRAARGSA